MAAALEKQVEKLLYDCQTLQAKLKPKFEEATELAGACKLLEERCAVASAYADEAQAVFDSEGCAAAAGLAFHCALALLC